MMIGRWLCKLLHPAGYPIRGKYECPVCLRHWRVDWKVTK
jgi:hypothetical protein